MWWTEPLKFFSSPYKTQLQVQTNTTTKNSHIHLSSLWTHFSLSSPPWQKTQLDYVKCFTIHQSTTDKDKVVARHNSFVNQAQYYPETLLIYLDGSQISFLNQFRWVGSAVVGYYQGREVFHWKLGLGGSAEVYDAELAGLITGLSESISFAYKHPEVYHIQLYADNISAISIAANPKL